MQATLAQITWYHNIALLEKVKSRDVRLWYVRQTIQSGWSRNILVHQIETGLYGRQGRAVTNFDRTLPPPQSELAQQILKTPITSTSSPWIRMHESRSWRKGCWSTCAPSCWSLASALPSSAASIPCKSGGEDFRIDLLFYHLRLRCFVVIDLKVTDFQPEFAGKMNFYLSAVDDLLHHPDDQPSIGLILCRGKNGIVAEYALRDLSKPIGIAEYLLTASLPEQLKGNLPTIEDLETELGAALGGPEPTAAD